MKTVVLMSGGIDSPVAAYIMSKVSDVILLHMDNRPYSDDRSISKVVKQAEQLRKVSGKEMPLYVAEHGKSQTSIKEVCGPYQCVMCKRVMMSVAAEFAKRIGASGVVMGDSLGQVASQTLKNIKAESAGLNFPVLRPLIGYDKLEIEAVGKEIGTYDISTMKEQGCSVVPVRPVTEAEPKEILELQSKLAFNELIEYSVSSIKRISGNN
jgi:Thiamine biosynthesis ATP pyrophosphatase